MLPYNPKDAETVWPEGDYQATIDSVEEKTSKAGNDMYEVKFTAFNGILEMHVADYIVIPDFVWKLKRLARAFGLDGAFEAGTFNPQDLVGKNLTLTLTVRKQEGFDDRNSVKGYKPKGSGSSSFTEAVERETKRINSQNGTNGTDEGPLPF